MLDKFHMLNYNPVTTPLEFDIKYSKAENDSLNKEDLALMC